MFRIGLRRFATTPVWKNAATKTPSTPLSWNEYFTMKKQLSRMNTAASALTGAASAVITLGYLGNIEIDVEKPIFGLDPMMVIAAAVMLGGGFGFLLGPFIGKPVFGLLNKKKMPQFQIKDQQFLERIKVNRADPSRSSMSNPVPDYYGEKIYSLNDYKQWLRDCNAFKRKAHEFL